jgi:hypothetical protein
MAGQGTLGQFITDHVATITSTQPATKAGMLQHYLMQLATSQDPVGERSQVTVPLVGFVACLLQEAPAITLQSR